MLVEKLPLQRLVKEIAQVAGAAATVTVAAFPAVEAVDVNAAPQVRDVFPELEVRISVPSGPTIMTHGVSTRHRENSPSRDLMELQRS